ncbi:MAG: translation initiation factor IF-2 [Paludibacteraceae bacterium]|nr:translation initiation factor IF-2 [Paludibacteraceae bacterium]
MAIRLGKLLTTLNIGEETAIEFLRKKGFDNEINVNVKLTDEQVNLLQKQFGKDQDLKKQSEALSNERKNKDASSIVVATGYEQETEKAAPAKKEKAAPKAEKNAEKPAAPAAGEEKTETPKIHTEVTPEEAPKATPAEPTKEEAKKEEAKKEEPKVTATPEKKEEKTVVETPAPEAKAAKPVAEATKEAKEAKPANTEKPVAKPAEAAIKPVVVPAQQQNTVVITPVEPSATPTVSSSTSSTTLAGPKIVGRIQLDSINQTTRPPKQKHEKNKKNKDGNKPNNGQNNNKPNNQNGKPKGEANGQNANNGDKKKRERIGHTKVDINAVVNQNKNNHNGNNNNNNNKDNRKDNKNAKNNKNVRNDRNVSNNAVSDEDMSKKIKEALNNLTNNKEINKKGATHRREKRQNIREQQQEQFGQELAESKILKITEFVTANELATMMKKSVNEIIGTCFAMGLVVSINQRLNAETINIVAEEFGFQTEFVSAEVVHAIKEEEVDESALVPRSPIVTVMGHVDHGKTSLLDYIRKSNVIAGEAGGITQHIGAYHVTLEDGRQITFLDTPGHEAFTAMRARGAQVTDIAIIIVAADDDVMPQTVEAINHAAAAGVPIVFAINKIDKPGANAEKVKESLAAMNYLVEEWGGKYQSQDISAKKGIGVNELLEKVLLEAELLDLKADPTKEATGSVIESSLDKGRGYVATLLVQNGTLHVGDVVLAGKCYGKVRAMFNERNQRIKEAGPAEPVIILGLNNAPQAGDKFNVFAAEHEARELANKREQLQREQDIRTTTHLTLDEIGRRIALGNFQEMNIIVKGDVDGSIEALSDSLIKLSTPELQVNIVHKAVGQISESDILLAAASNAIIVGFQVRPSMAARKLAEQEQIDIRLYSIIYDAIEEVKAAMEGMLSPEVKEVVTATLEVLQTFKISKVGTVAGCLVRDGKIKRGNKIRLIRDGIVVYTGDLASLKRMKDDVKEVPAGMDCGLNLDKYNDIKVGDIIESYEEVEEKRTLS